MTYKGYEITMCREQCEVWSLDDDGEPIEFDRECRTHTKQETTYYLHDGKTGEVLGAAYELEGVKKYADVLALGLPV